MNKSCGYFLSVPQLFCCLERKNILKRTDKTLNDLIEKIKPFLIDYVREITKPSRNGGKNQYICPLCNSGTGSHHSGAFTVYPDTNSYHCFACGANGDIFNLYEEVNHISDFTTIANELSKKYHLPSSDYGNTRSTSNSLLQMRSHVYMNMNRDKIAVKTIYKKLDGSKTARWERYEGNTLVKNLNGLQMPLYHVYNLTDNTKPVFIVEGEKDVETMENLGYIATTSPNGAGSKWKDEYTKYFKDFDVIILADNDEVGLKHATNIAEGIIQTARSVKLVPLQALYEPLKPKGDISDIVECIGSVKAIKLIDGILKGNKYIFTSNSPSEPLYEQQNIPNSKRQIITYELFAEFIEKHGYSIRYNQITHNFEFFGFGENESKEHLAENVPTILQDQLKLIYTHVTSQTIMNYITLYATRNRYNPILSAIQAVKWDGIDRVNQIYDIFKIPTDTEEGIYSRIFIFKWLKQCVCGLFNDIDNPFSLDIILVFQGKQGIGKTRFFEMLALNPKFFGEGVCLDPRDKDSIMQSTSKWISELGEIGSTMRKDMDSVKAFLTKSTDEYRTPYGKASLHYPRMTSFVGTVNDEQFLIDQTGNRRFVTIPLASDLVIDYNIQIKPFNALQLWSQIYSIVKDEDKSSCFRLTEDEKKYLEKRNAAFVKPMKGEFEVLDILEEQQTPQQGYICTFKEMTVLQFIQLHNLRYDVNVIGKVLKKYGYVSKKKYINGVQTRVIEFPYKYFNTNNYL